MTDRYDVAADALKARVQRKVGTTERNEITCPRAKTSMTPCIARDGHTALADDRDCVGCGAKPLDLLRGMLEDSDADACAVETNVGRRRDT